MPLTAKAIENAKPRDRAYRLHDGRGMYLEVTPKGGKLWRIKYRIGGKEKRLSLGTFPETSLAQARDRRKTIREQLQDGIDPSAARKATKQAAENTFRALALEWLTQQGSVWTADYTAQVRRRIEEDLFPRIGDKGIEEITAPVLLEALRRVERRGAVETAHRLLQKCGQIFRYGIVTGRGTRDVAADLRGALPPVKGGKRAAITDPAGVGQLLRAIDGYVGQPQVMYALRLLPYVFVRPGELRSAEWAEIDLEEAMWRIPAQKMKLRREHLVPLSTRAVELLRALKPITGDGRLVFPGLRSKARPISENTLNAALRRLGYSTDDMTSHGFRAVASTLLNEQGWPADAIERQLAHAPRDEVRAAYHRAEHLETRKKMMQAWADYLDVLREGAGKVTLIGAARR